jgi:large subunit ribosomal protein L4
MELTRIDSHGQVVGVIDAQDSVFAKKYNEPLVHQLVVSYQANARLMNRKQKDRGQVHHSTRKPFKQKGTGSARAGMTSSPLWRGGGRIFPNTPDENFTQKVNRKMYRSGLATIFSQLARENRIVVVDDFSVDTPKTKAVFQKLKNMRGGDALVLVGEMDENLLLASRNLKDTLVLEVRWIDPVSLVNFSKVILTKAALAVVEELLS